VTIRSATQRTGQSRTAARAARAARQHGGALPAIKRADRIVASLTDLRTILVRNEPSLKNARPIDMLVTHGPAPLIDALAGNRGCGMRLVLGAPQCFADRFAVPE
jgi:hypothetical protein